MSATGTAAARRRRPRAGRALRAGLDKALAAAGRELGQQLAWTEVEALTLEKAAAAADRCEELQRVYAARLAEGAEVGPLVKLSAELRLVERQVVDLVGRVSIRPGPIKSERHQRAVRARWDRRDQAWAAAREGSGA